MSTDIYSLTEAAHQGNWRPLIQESEKAPGKNWAERARCANYDTEIFVPLGDGPYEDPEEVKRRLGISLLWPLNLCGSCPLAVAARCLVDSLRYDDEFGIRAGLLASERSSLRAGWQKRLDEESVVGALRGVTAVLSKAEQEEVVARFVADPSLSSATVARGLGVRREYLLALARRYRQRSAPRSPSAVHDADAA